MTPTDLDALAALLAAHHGAHENDYCYCPCLGPARALLEAARREAGLLDLLYRIENAANEGLMGSRAAWNGTLSDIEDWCHDARTALLHDNAGASERGDE